MFFHYFKRDFLIAQQERWGAIKTSQYGSWLHNQKFAAAKDLQVLTIWLFLFSSPRNNCSNTTFSGTKNICMHLYQSQIIWTVPITYIQSFRGLPAGWDKKEKKLEAVPISLRQENQNWTQLFFCSPCIALGFILKQTQLLLNTDSTGVLFT